MEDKCNRKITYLRLSITDLCNYRCIYCMPECGIKKKSHDEIASIEELFEYSKVAVSLGVKKIRLTGGEPLVRKGILDLCEKLKSLTELEELTITTNGTMLKSMAKDLRNAGVDRINISLDTLDKDKFRLITRCGSLEEVLDGIDTVLNAGFKSTKINTVLLGGINEDDIIPLAELTRTKGINVRFIELMPIGVCSTWSTETFIHSDVVLDKLPELSYESTDGVSEIYRLPGADGSIGLIRPMSNKFCHQCNRIRITSDGKLKPCLHSRTEIDLRGYDAKALYDVMKDAIYNKPEEHHLDLSGHSEAIRNMYGIGG